MNVFEWKFNNGFLSSSRHSVLELDTSVEYGVSIAIPDSCSSFSRFLQDQEDNESEHRRVGGSSERWRQFLTKHYAQGDSLECVHAGDQDYPCLPMDAKERHGQRCVYSRVRDAEMEDKKPTRVARRTVTRTARSKRESDGPARDKKDPHAGTFNRLLTEKSDQHWKCTTAPYGSDDTVADIQSPFFSACDFYMEEVPRDDDAPSASPTTPPEDRPTREGRSNSPKTHQDAPGTSARSKSRSKTRTRENRSKSSSRNPRTDAPDPKKIVNETVLVRLTHPTRERRENFSATEFEIIQPVSDHPVDEEESGFIESLIARQASASSGTPVIRKSSTTNLLGRGNGAFLAASPQISSVNVIEECRSILPALLTRPNLKTFIDILFWQTLTELPTLLLVKPAPVGLCMKIDCLSVISLVLYNYLTAVLKKNITWVPAWRDSE